MNENEEHMQVTTEKSNSSTKNRTTKKKMVWLIIIVSAIVAAALLFLFFGNRIGKPKGVTTITTSNLEKVLEISELSTVSNRYSAIVQVKDDFDKIKYYVAYEGIVKVGIDFNEILIDVNDEEKVITITLPEPKVLDSSVDMGTLDFIFIDKKAETESVTIEAYKKAKQDLETRAGKEDILLELAEENAIDAVTALIKPWVKQIDNEFKVTVR